MTSKQVTSPPWNSRRLVHSKEMAWASRWSVALRAFYRQILSSSNCKDFFFKWHRPPRKLAKEVFVKFIPAKEKTRFAKEWRKVLAKDHVIRIDSHEVFNTAQLGIPRGYPPRGVQKIPPLSPRFRFSALRRQLLHRWLRSPLGGPGGRDWWSATQIFAIKKTWLVGLYRGLYYPVIYGL